MYNERLQANKKQQDFQKDCAQKAENEAAEEAQKAEGLEEKIRDCFGIKGKLESQIEAYSRQEEQFNRKYQEKLVRNILGNYEAGTLEIRQQIYSQELADAERKKVESQKKRETDKEAVRSQERRLEDQRENCFEKNRDTAPDRGVRAV